MNSHFLANSLNTQHRVWSSKCPGEELASKTNLFLRGGIITFTVKKIFKKQILALKKIITATGTLFNIWIPLV